MKIKTILAAGATALALATPALAAPITAPGTFVADETVTFDGFAVGTSGPISVGDMTVSADNWIVRAQGFTQHVDIFEGQYFGQGVNVITLSFLRNVTHVGFGLFDPNIPTTSLSAFDRAGNLLETMFPVTGPPGGGTSSYVGFERALGDIASVVVTPQGGDLLGIDTISWQLAVPVSQVPLPAAGFVLVGALGGLFGLRRRKQA